MSNKSRPLSPHLQIYKPQISSILSIMHRATGVFASLGVIFFVWWLYSLSEGPTAYTLFQKCVSSPLGQLFLLAWVFAISYHFYNGIRHLLWDIGKGFEIKSLHLSGWLVVIASFLTTGLICYFWYIA